MIKDGQHFCPPPKVTVFFFWVKFTCRSLTQFWYFFPRSSRQQQKMCIFLPRKICRPHTWLNSSFPEKKYFCPSFCYVFFPTIFFSPDKFRTYSPSFRERKIKRHRKNKDLLTNSSDNYSPKASKVKLFPGEQIR